MLCFRTFISLALVTAVLSHVKHMRTFYDGLSIQDEMAGWHHGLDGHEFE